VWGTCGTRFSRPGRPIHSETGSSYISAVVVYWPIVSKFGTQADFDLYWRFTSPKSKPEVNLRRRGRRGRHLEKYIWCHNSTSGRSIGMKFCRPTQDGMRTTTKWSESKPEIKIQYGGRLFSETGSSYNSVTYWPIMSKFGIHIRSRWSSISLFAVLCPCVKFRNIFVHHQLVIN